MKRASITSAIALAAAVAALTAVSARTMVEDGKATSSPTAVEERYAQTPMGVDPMVTGPVSDEFRARQDALGCDRAEWPAVPAGCYPD